MRRKPSSEFEHRPGGRHYRSQLDRIERRVAGLWWLAVLAVIVFVLSRL